MPLVEIIGKGFVEFPDDWSNDQIADSVRKNHLLDEQEKVQAEDLGGVFGQELRNELVGNFKQAGIGVAQGMAQLAAGANKLIEVAIPYTTTGIALDLLAPDVVRKAQEQFGGASDVASDAAEDLAQLGQETPGSALPRAITAGVISSIPSFAAAPLGFPAMVAAAGLQQFGTRQAELERQFQRAGEDPTTARGHAFPIALASGVITSLVTLGFGRTGVEALPGMRAALESGAARSTLEFIGRAAGLEGIEEFTNEIWQVVLDELTLDPNKSLEEIFTRAFGAMAVGGIVGGGLAGAVSLDMRQNDVRPVAEARQSVTPTPPTLEVDESSVRTAEATPTIPAAPIIPAEPILAAPDLTPETALDLIRAKPTITEKELDSLLAQSEERLPPGEEAPAALDEILPNEPPVDETLVESITNPLILDEEAEAQLQLLTREAGPDSASVDVSRDFAVTDRLHSPQFNFESGRMGTDARDAWRLLHDTESIMVESIARDQEFIVNDIMARLPAAWKTRGAESFYNLLDGQDLTQIETELNATEMPDADRANILELASRVKGRLENMRGTIRDVLRDDMERTLTNLPNSTFERLVNNAFPNLPTPFTFTGNSFYDAQARSYATSQLAAQRYPNDWAFADGTYLPHMFAGDWVIRDSAGNFVARARSQFAAETKLYELNLQGAINPAINYTIAAEINMPADVVRLGNKKMHAFIGSLATELQVPKEDVQEAARGIVGRRAGKKRFSGFLQKRKGAPNYETDFSETMSAYVQGIHKWAELNKLTPQVVPIIDEIAKTRPNAARDLNALYDDLWGRPSQVSRDFDAQMRRIPILRRIVEPRSLDRWLGRTRGVAATLFLATGRYIAVNAIQPLMGLLPVVGPRLFARAKLLQHSSAGQTILDRYGVRFDTGAFTSPGFKGKLAKFRDRVIFENSNQEMGFLALYLHGLDTGMRPDDAARYAKRRGQLFTQFRSMVTDRPTFMRNPISATTFQFLRFTIKNLELYQTMALERNFPALARLALSFLLMTGVGGAIFRQLFLDREKALRAKRKMDEAFGEGMSDIVYHGLPALAGVDLTGSLMLLDEPFGRGIFEKLGRKVAGPTVQLGVDLATIATTEPRTDEDRWNRLRAATRKIPAFKPMDEIISLAEGDTDVRDASGEVKYRRALTNLAQKLTALGGFTSIEQSKVRLWVDGIVAVQKEQSELLNELFVTLQASGDTEPTLEEMRDFNLRWPEGAFTTASVNQYVERRKRGLKETDIQRMIPNKFESLLPESQRR